MEYSDRVIQPNILDKNVQNDPDSLSISKRLNGEIISTADTVENDSVCDNTQVHQHKNAPPTEELNISNENNKQNNFIQIDQECIEDAMNASGNDSENIETEDQVIKKTTLSIINLNKMISEQKDSEIFGYKNSHLTENTKCNNDSININNEIGTETTSVLMEDDRSKDYDLINLNENLSINISLKILENMVNIEHNKLIKQKLMENKSQKSNTLPEINNHHNCSDVNKKKDEISKIKNHKVSEKHKSSLKSEKSKNHNRTEKIIKCNKDFTSKKNHNKLESQNNFPKLSLRNSGDSMEIQNDSNNTSISISDSTSNESNSTNTTNISMSEIGNILENVLEPQNTNSSLSANVLEIHSNVTEISPIRKQNLNNQVITYHLNEIPKKTNLNLSTNLMIKNKSRYIQHKSSDVHYSTLKKSDYKKLYEKDRRSLFNPDIVFNSSLPKDPKNKTNTKSNNNLSQESSDLVSKKSSKTKRFQPQTSKRFSSSKKRFNYDSYIESIKSNIKSKLKISTKPELNDVKDLPQSQTRAADNKYKRLKMYDSQIDDNIIDDKKKKRKLNKNCLENKTSRNIINNTEPCIRNKSSILDPCETVNSNNDSQMTGEKSDTLDQSKSNQTPEWIEKLIKQHNIKTLWIAIDRNAIY